MAQSTRRLLELGAENPAAAVVKYNTERHIRAQRGMNLNKVHISLQLLLLSPLPELSPGFLKCHQNI